MMNIHFISLGCPKNLVDSERIMGGLQGNSVKIVTDPRKADAIVINTCGFVEDAKKESIETIFSAIHLKKTGYCQHVFVTGCLSQRYMKELRKEIPEIDGLWGVENINQIPSEMAGILGLEKQLITNTRFITNPVYAYLKIAEGCDNHCSFCAIPNIRGKHKSRSEEEILAEAKWLSQNGIQELILVSQDTTYYGADLQPKPSLTGLLRKLEKIEGIHWIRLLYAYPERIDNGLIDFMAHSEKTCSYLDIPIQHVSDRILHRMKRGSRKQSIERLINWIRGEIADVAIRTSLMVGFPGETEREFEELMQFVEFTEFDRLGVFQFSAEDGTEAAKYPNQIPDDVKSERFNRLMELQQDISVKRNQKYIGRKVEVLIDQLDNKNGHIIGRTQWDAPEIDQYVHIQKPAARNNFVWVTIHAAAENDLYGELI